jgi:thioredoxin-like negative regulator of GroEL
LTPFERTVAAATVLARVRLERQGVVLDGDVDLTLDHLLAQSATDEAARTNLLTVLDALGPEDPRYLVYRRRLMNLLH